MIHETLTPSGLCECGCGERTKLAVGGGNSTIPVGQPNRFLHGHHRRRDLLERLIEKIEFRGSDHWLWVGARNDAGYGQFNVGNRMRLAHRVVYELLVGPIPDGLQTDHLCRNRACVNPAHLEMVTSHENTLRGLGTKLSDAQVKEIEGSTEIGPVLAERYGISESYAYALRGGRRRAAA